MLRPGRRRSRGQSTVELALIGPLLVLICMGTVDLAQAFRYDIAAAGAARAGMKTGTQADTSDIGQAIRAEPNSVIDAGSAWGPEAAGGTDANCNQLVPSTGSCGDPSGCPTPFTTSGQVACFAIRTCTLAGTGNTPYSCTSFGAWGSRPSPGQGQALQVRVVLAYKAFTPVIGKFAGNGGVFYLTDSSEGLQLY